MDGQVSGVISNLAALCQKELDGHEEGSSAHEACARYASVLSDGWRWWKKHVFRPAGKAISSGYHWAKKQLISYAHYAEKGGGVQWKEQYADERYNGEPPLEEDPWYGNGRW